MVGFSDWHTIDQKQINRFAEATLDDQWIHINEEKAKKRRSLPINHCSWLFVIIADPLSGNKLLR